ncbi:hypothetical protein BDV98DRAFT_584612 [Pterulicium gracile]|uniref:Uncharacterized protein n=1 Tax=Pterulicium gracile TaxID=1884261 RepID=A0A5C3QAY3_9AGAR|nr:hypothetical protein BDV98DRAFT_584612 [Pterula gracilis]
MLQYNLELRLNRLRRQGDLLFPTTKLDYGVHDNKGQYPPIPKDQEVKMGKGGKCENGLPIVYRVLCAAHHVPSIPVAIYHPRKSALARFSLQRERILRTAFFAVLKTGVRIAVLVALVNAVIHGGGRAVERHYAGEGTDCLNITACGHGLDPSLEFEVVTTTSALGRAQTICTNEGTAEAVLLKKDLAKLSKSVKERKTVLLQELSRKEALSSADEHWLAQEGKLIDEERIVETLDNASGYEREIARINNRRQFPCSEAKVPEKERKKPVIVDKKVKKFSTGKKQNASLKICVEALDVFHGLGQKHQGKTAGIMKDR